MSDNFFDELEKNNNENIKKETYNNVSNDIEKNINFFIILAKIVQILFFILAVIMFFVSLSVLTTGFNLFIAALIYCFSFIILGFIIPPFLKWKAYTLKSLYEINNKK